MTTPPTGSCLHRIGVIITPLRGNAHLGAIAGKGLRHILVRRAQSRALRVERRIVLIGLHQGPFERVRCCIRNSHANAGNGQRKACNGPNMTPAPLLHPSSDAAPRPPRIPRGIAARTTNPRGGQQGRPTDRTHDIILLEQGVKPPQASLGTKFRA